MAFIVVALATLVVLASRSGPDGGDSDEGASRVGNSREVPSRTERQVEARTEGSGSTKPLTPRTASKAGATGGEETAARSGSKGAEVDTDAANATPLAGGTLRHLAVACASSPGRDGFGSVRIDRPLKIEGAEGDIAVPCTLVFEGEGRLTLSDVVLRTRNLNILGDEDDTTSRVVIEGSRLIGSGDASLAIFLRGEDASVAIRTSKIDYPFAVLVRGGREVEVIDSAVTSVGEATKGMVISGTALRINRVQMKTSHADGPVVIGDRCEIAELDGATPRCKGAG